MCGIAGFNWNDPNLIKKMNNSLKHRGPDGFGTYTDNLISLGHRRLAIIDLTERGKQPMEYEHKGRKAIITYNGEVYNFLELREKLEKKGYKFKSNTDTEVILASYLEWGFDCVKKFNGMWAFCIYDLQKKILFCSRDRMGQKPFYYYYDGERFIFASEIKAIIAAKKINKKENIYKEAVQLYFALGFIPAPYSIYKNTFKLEARQNLVFDLNKKKIKKWYYWDLPRYNPIYDKKKLIKEGKKLLYDAVKLRMRSDVPVGAFLSGGLDSSSVVGIMRKFTDLSKLHTFSIGFEGKYDETPYIKIVGNHFKTNHHHYYFKEKDFEELIDKYIWVYDEPFGDYSGFPTYKVSELAKQFVTVVLSGDGGDEIFGGYLNHVNGYRMDLIRKFPKIFRILFSRLPIKKNLNGIANLYLLKEAFGLSLVNPEKFYAESIKENAIRPEIYKKWTIEKMKFCLSKGNNKLGEALRIFDLLFNTLSDNFLVKVDRASMANALEVRSPFLDYRFAEFSQKIPTKWKVDLFKTKKLMREIIKDILPNEIVNRGKQGFTPPLTDWILKRNYLNEIIEKAEVLKEVDNELYRYISTKITNKKYNKNNQDNLNISLLIRLFLFIKWWEKWIKE